MKVLILGRHASMMSIVLDAVSSAGYDAKGVLTDSEAFAELRSGGFQVVTIGGGVEPVSREKIKQEAKQFGTTPLDVFGPDDLLTKLKELGN